MGDKRWADKRGLQIRIHWHLLVYPLLPWILNIPDTIYIGTGDRDASDSYGEGVFKSTDGGLTWKSSNSGMGDKTVGKLIIDPNNTNILLAGTNGGIYRSTNGGSVVVT